MPWGCDSAPWEEPLREPRPEGEPETLEDLLDLVVALPSVVLELEHLRLRPFGELVDVLDAGVLQAVLRADGEFERIDALVEVLVVLEALALLGEPIEGGRVLGGEPKRRREQVTRRKEVSEGVHGDTGLDESLGVLCVEAHERPQVANTDRTDAKRGDHLLVRDAVRKDGSVELKGGERLVLSPQPVRPRLDELRRGACELEDAQCFLVLLHVEEKIPETDPELARSADGRVRREDELHGPLPLVGLRELEQLLLRLREDRFLHLVGDLGLGGKPEARETFLDDLEGLRAHPRDPPVRLVPDELEHPVDATLFHGPRNADLEGGGIVPQKKNVEILQHGRRAPLCVALVRPRILQQNLGFVKDYAVSRNVLYPNR